LWSAGALDALDVRAVLAYEPLLPVKQMNVATWVVAERAVTPPSVSGLPSLSGIAGKNSGVRCIQPAPAAETAGLRGLKAVQLSGADHHRVVPRKNSVHSIVLFKPLAKGSMFFDYSLSVDRR
jgi:hypothetical protein